MPDSVMNEALNGGTTMRYRYILWTVLAFLFVAFVAVEPALAGPGGKIARAMFETFWGKVLLFFLIIFFLPLILYTYFREKLAERRARTDLRYISSRTQDKRFEWLVIKERVLDCFHRVHAAWSREDVSDAAEYMTDWYWQNQQIAFLDRWEQEGLVNHCHVKKVTAIKPLLLIHRNDEFPHEGSMLVVSVCADMKDYLANRATGKIVEGSDKYKLVETVWTFTMVGGKWRVSNIEEDTYSLAYAKMVKELPRIEDTMAEEAKA